MMSKACRGFGNPMMILMGRLRRLRIRYGLFLYVFMFRQKWPYMILWL
jgi:hypothetical protein